MVSAWIQMIRGLEEKLNNESEIGFLILGQFLVKEGILWVQKKSLNELRQECVSTHEEKTTFTR